MILDPPRRTPDWFPTTKEVSAAIPVEGIFMQLLYDMFEHRIQDRRHGKFFKLVKSLTDKEVLPDVTFLYRKEGLDVSEVGLEWRKDYKNFPNERIPSKEENYDAVAQCWDADFLRIGVHYCMKEEPQYEE